MTGIKLKRSSKKPNGVKAENGVKGTMPVVKHKIKTPVPVQLEADQMDSPKAKLNHTTANNHQERPEKKEKKERKKSKTKTTPSPVVPSTKILKTGGDLTRLPIVFTNDASYYFAATGSTIAVHSVATSKIVRRTIHATPSADLKQKDCEVTFVGVHPANHIHLYTAGLDGVIRIWDWADGILVKTIKAPGPIKHAAFIPSSEPTLVVSTQQPKLSKQDVYIMQLYQSSQEPKRILQSLKIDSLSVNKHIVAVVTGDKIKVVDIESLRTHTYAAPSIVTVKIACLAVHPTDPVFAIGDTGGKIYIHYHKLQPQTDTKTADIKEHEWTTNCQTLHWHAHGVYSLAFSSSGTHLLSGGPEAVLVQWHLTTRQRSYLPRLGGALAKISVSPDSILIALVLQSPGNAIKIIRAADSREVSKCDGLRAVGNVLEGYANDNTVVVDALNGYLQVWDYSRGIGIAEFDITPHNRITSGHVPKLPETSVQQATFSSSKKWMVTLDSTSISTSVNLKFWSQIKNSYMLNTVITDPHGNDKVTSIKFHPTKDIVVTTSAGGDFKVFTLTKFTAPTLPNKKHDTQVQQQELEQWVCVSSSSFRSLPCTSSAFSKDGSLLVLSFGHMITLWDAHTFTLVSTLEGCDEKDTIAHLLCVGAYVVSLSRKGNLSSWDLLALERVYTSHTATYGFDEKDHPVTMIETRDSSSFALLGKSRVLGFNVESDKVMDKYEIKDGVLKARFVKQGLLVLTRDKHVAVISKEIETEQAKANGTNEEKLKETKSKNFSSMFTATTTSSSLPTPAATPKPSFSRSSYKSVTSVLPFLDNPTHVIPPPHMWLSKYLESVLHIRNDEQQEEKTMVDDTTEVSTQHDNAKTNTAPTEVEELDMDKIGNFDFLRPIFV